MATCLGLGESDGVLERTGYEGKGKEKGGGCTGITRATGYTTHVRACSMLLLERNTYHLLDAERRMRGEDLVLA